MNRIAKVWEELDKKNGRHANLSKVGQRKNVKLASKVSDIENFEEETDYLYREVEAGRQKLDDIYQSFEMELSQFNVLLELINEMKPKMQDKMDDLEEAFENIGVPMAGHPVQKLFEERNRDFDENESDIKKASADMLSKITNVVRNYIGS
tara:strand:+ start:10995 stop:11447 length:453 start_codon:yes stop_codon:yes gene_type:complete